MSYTQHIHVFIKTFAAHDVAHPVTWCTNIRTTMATIVFRAAARRSNVAQLMEEQ